MYHNTYFCKLIAYDFPMFFPRKRAILGVTPRRPLVVGLPALPVTPEKQCFFSAKQTVGRMGF